MRIPPRIAIPIGLAATLSIVIGAVFLWQIKASVRTIESAFHAPTQNFFSRIWSGDSNKEEQPLTSEALVALREGELLEFRGEWQKAEEKYRGSVSEGGGAAALRKLISLLLQRRKFQDAENAINELGTEKGEEADAAFLRGILALRTGNAQRAREIFEASASLPSSQYGLAFLAISAGDHEKANATLTAAAQGSDLDVREAAKILLKAYEEFALFPDGQEIHLKTLLARALTEVGECETALPMLQSVLSEQSRYRDAWIVKGYCEFTTERTPTALVSLEQAYALDPEKPEIQYFLARTHMALGDAGNAVTFLQYALENGFEPEKDARELLAEYALRRGDPELALSELNILAEREDATLASHRQYVLTALTIPNHVSDGFDMAKRAAAKWPTDPGALALAGRAALAAGMREDARQYIDQALKIDPKNKEAQEVATQLK